MVDAALFRVIVLGGVALVSACGSSDGPQAGDASIDRRAASDGASADSASTEDGGSAADATADAPMDVVVVDAGADGFPSEGPPPPPM